MSRNETTIGASPEEVWELLAHPPTYHEWVVGNQAIRGHDGNWPAPGTEFKRRVGFGPLAVSDRTVSMAAETGRRLVMNVRALPVGHGIVTFTLEPAGAEGTRLVMEERPAGGPARFVWFLCNPLIKLRNAETLRRLKRCTEARGAVADDG